MAFEIPNNFQVAIRFCTTNNDKKWLNFKKLCEGGKRLNTKICEEWLKNCRLNSNKNLNILTREEGGIGGNNNRIHKQIRFRNNRVFIIPSNDIILDQIYNAPDEQWTFEELHDLMVSFKKLMVKELGCASYSIVGKIEYEAIDLENY